MKQYIINLTLAIIIAACATATRGAAMSQTQPADFIATEILGRPTNNSITVNVVPAIAMELNYEYGLVAGQPLTQTALQTATASLPLETVISPLQPNTRYYYRLRYRASGAAEFTRGAEHTFMTARAPDSTFTFAIQGDSHPERTQNQFNADLYRRTLQSVAAGQPDFYITMGDDFSVDTLKTVNADTVKALYVTQRQWLGLVGAPLFLVNGNHEQAALVNLNGTPDNVAVWAQTARNAYYPQPAPDAFYTGNAEPVQYIGLLRNYYAWTWGDALFVVIDPYWHSPVAVDNVFGRSRKARQTRDMWGITLGEAQYQWFKQTLETSTAKYKFVFAHHVNSTGRGGVELANLYEWGGYNPKNAWQFNQYRPNWSLPLHSLMAKNGVTIFFQGHDHIFVRQELDGVVYQTLPEPANPFYTYENNDAYKSGAKFPNSGHVSVTVAPTGVTVNYLRAFLPKDENATQRNGAVVYSYTLGAPTTAATFPGNVILGSPTDSSIVANLLAEVNLNVYFTYRAQGNSATISQTNVISLPAAVPVTLTLTSLQPNTAYDYQIHFQRVGTTTFESAATASFHTQRAAGTVFTFTIDADPHNREANFNGDVFALTMQNALNDHPDFNIDMGDTFMTEKAHATTYNEVVQTMLDMRPYFAKLGQSAPLYLVNGNHEGELGWLLDGQANNLAIWSTQARQSYYPNPTPGGFYSGSATTEPFIGRRDSYYAWTWGDALFVVLDPFWYTAPKPTPGEGNWGWTLGKAQYDWFRQTLESSQAKFKFVFAHHVVGGTNDQYGIARGGVEVAKFYEWGGYNWDGSWGFDTKRPGWGKPIHQLLVDNHVAIFFHGHDHLFVKQELDGVVYQELPQPSNRGYDDTRSAAEYGYVNGVILGSSGHLRVKVSPTNVTVDYVKTYLPADETAQRVNGTVSYSYRLGRAGVYLPLLMR